VKVNTSIVDMLSVLIGENSRTHCSYFPQNNTDQSGVQYCPAILEIIRAVLLKIQVSRDVQEGLTQKRKALSFLETPL
jgi:hypothetical protein